MKKRQIYALVEPILTTRIISRSAHPSQHVYHIWSLWDLATKFFILSIHHIAGLKDQGR